MNLRHIEVFHAVYINGSVIGAARTLHVSQPSVSRVLGHAESRLGFPLFRRIKGRLIATEEAHVLFREINELQGRLLSIKQTANNLKGGIASYLRLAVLPALGLEAAPLAAARLLVSHPTANLDIQTLHHEDMLQSLMERDADLAIGFDPPNHPRLDGFEIGKGELVAFFRRDALTNVPKRVSLRHLEGQNFISLANSGPVGNLFSSEMVARNLELKEQISIRTFYVAAGLVKAGAGIAVIDEYTAKASLTSDVDYRPLDPPIDFRVHCIFLTDRPPSRLGSAFVDTFSKVLKKA